MESPTTVELNATFTIPELFDTNGAIPTATLFAAAKSTTCPATGFPNRSTTVTVPV